MHGVLGCAQPETGGTARKEHDVQTYRSDAAAGGVRGGADRAQHRDGRDEARLQGLPPASQKSFEKAFSDANAFFPANIRIRTGDVVAFQPVGFHTVDMPASGAPLPLLGPTGKKVAASDAAGIPFWFNARDEIGFDKRLLKPSYGKTLVKSPARIMSGLPLGNKLKPIRVRFKKAGLYTYYCNIHPG